MRRSIIGTPHTTAINAIPTCAYNANKRMKKTSSRQRDECTDTITGSRLGRGCGPGRGYEFGSIKHWLPVPTAKRHTHAFVRNTVRSSRKPTAMAVVLVVPNVRQRCSRALFHAQYYGALADIVASPTFKTAAHGTSQSHVFVSLGVFETGLDALHGGNTTLERSAATAGTVTRADCTTRCKVNSHRDARIPSRLY